MSRKRGTGSSRWHRGKIEEAIGAAVGDAKQERENQVDPYAGTVAVAEMGMSVREIDADRGNKEAWLARLDADEIVELEESPELIAAKAEELGTDSAELIELVLRERARRFETFKKALEGMPLEEFKKMYVASINGEESKPDDNKPELSYGYVFSSAFNEARRLDGLIAEEAKRRDVDLNKWWEEAG